MTSGVYQIVNLVNGHRYVGRSKNIEHRFYSHRFYLRHNKHHCIYLQRAWNKYGELSFRFEIIFNELNSEEQIAIEQNLIDNTDNKYNISMSAKFGGDLTSMHPNHDKIVDDKRKIQLERFRIMSQDERKIVCGRPGKQNGMYGKTHSETARKRISAANTGHSRNKGLKRTREQRARLSEIAKQRTGSKNPFYGKHHSAETKQKIALQNKGKVPTNARKVVFDGVVYESVTALARVLGVTPSAVVYRAQSGKFGIHYLES